MPGPYAPPALLDRETYWKFASRTIQARAGWLYFFVIFQFVLQLLLLVPGIDLWRFVPRLLTFLSSLLFLVFLTGRGPMHPSAKVAMALTGLLAIMILHPTGGAPLAIFAQFTLTVAIFAPLFWVSRIAVTDRDFGRIITLLWFFNTTSAFFGVLQVYFPGQFNPEISAILHYRKGGVEMYDIRLASGETIPRPQGLSDSPGGAATAGLYAALLGIGLLTAGRTSWIVRLGTIGSVLIGLFCIYVSHVRSVLVMTGVCMITFLFMMLRRGKVVRATIVGVLGFVAFSSGLTWAVTMGGEGVLKRFTTLVDESPGDVYYRNRGHFVESTIDKIPSNFFGAGLGRWGMMASYFQTPYDQLLWAEIQMTGWLYDGGVPMMLLYYAMIFVALWVAFRAARRHTDITAQAAHWAALVFAYNVGALAVTFNYPLFIGQGGMEFWLLNAALFAMISYQRAQNALPLPPPGHLQRI